VIAAEICRAMLRPEQKPAQRRRGLDIVDENIEFSADDPAALGDFSGWQFKIAGERSKQENRINS